jgi:hypothetical protein
MDDEDLYIGGGLGFCTFLNEVSYEMRFVSDIGITYTHSQQKEEI